MLLKGWLLLPVGWEPVTGSCVSVVCKQSHVVFVSNLMSFVWLKWPRIRIMEFKEIEGDRTKSKLLETTDHHIYRRNKAKFFSVQPPPVQESVQEPVQETRTCGVCLVEPLNAIWQCGHLLCVKCAKKIKSHQTRALRVCHLCRAPAKSFFKIRGTY